jgi:hypothetical protein
MGGESKQKERKKRSKREETGNYQLPPPYRRLFAPNSTKITLTQFYLLAF